MEAVRYVHQNPSEAMICSYNRYRWSSYAAYVEGGEAAFPPLPIHSVTEFVLDVFGGMDGLVRFHSEEGDFDLTRQAARVPVALSEAASRALAKELLGAERLAALPSLRKAERDVNLATLKKAGLSVRQIERITGIGRNIIQRA